MPPPSRTPVGSQGAMERAQPLSPHEEVATRDVAKKADSGLAALCLRLWPWVYPQPRSPKRPGHSEL